MVVPDTVEGLLGCCYPDPLKDPKDAIPKSDPPITTLRILGDHWEVPCFGSFRGSG